MIAAKNFAHFPLVRLKHVARLNYGESLESSVRDDHGDLVVFGSNGPVGKHNKANTGRPAIIVGRKGSFGSITYSGEHAFAIDTAYFVDASSTRSHLRWLFYALQTLGLDELSQDTGVPGLSRTSAYEALVPTPSPECQIAIADFLDRETAKADALVAKYQRLIELLEEKHVALITQAVTKGLDPNVPMKDSGVDWIGEIPAHWSAVRLAPYILDKSDGPFGSGLKNEHYADSGVRVIRLQNISAGAFRGDDAVFVTEDYFLSLNGHDARPGDLLVAGLGDENNHLGRACVFPPIAPVAMVKADCFRYRLDEGVVLTKFVAAYLNSSAGRFASSMQSRGATRQRMNLGALGAISIPLPGRKEQGNIVEFLERADVLFQRQRRAIRDAIELTEEHRSAVITAAVTGQIDVSTYKGKDLEEVVA